MWAVFIVNGKYYLHLSMLLDIIITIMPRKIALSLPLLQRLLKEFGENIHLARLRRKFSAELLSKRAGISRPTLRSVENGDPRVTLGACANVLLCLGLEKDLALIGSNDVLGRKLQDANLTMKKRAPRRPKAI